MSSATTAATAVQNAHSGHSKRHWGIDGPDGCLLNGQLTYESAFELNPNGYTPFSPSSYTADRLFVPLNSDSAQVDIKGTATYHTLVSNTTHDIKGVRFELQGVRNWPSGLLAQPTGNTGFTLSYSRRPVPQILRLSQEPSSDAFSADNVELWTNPGPGQRWQDLAHAPLDTRHDYGGVDYYWLECESIACRVNRVWDLMRKAYAECRERVEEPDLYAGEEEGGMPLHCRVYLADPTVAAYGGLALLLIMVVGLRYCTNRFRRRKRVDVEGVHRGRYEMRGKEKN